MNVSAPLPKATCRWLGRGIANLISILNPEAIVIGGELGAALKPFLDEIRELNPVMQAKILTLLDTRRFRRLGSVHPISVDVRFVAATNRILLDEVKQGKFRDDLYYRLQVIAINIPPLRERGEDVFVLTEHFLRKFAARHGRIIRGLEPAVEEIFRRYRWHVILSVV